MVAVLVLLERHNRQRPTEFCMPLAILIFTFLASLGWCADILLGSPGNRKLKDTLTNFYVSLEEGDWTVLYRYPASALLAFMVHVVGPNPFSFRYFLKTTVVSAIATISLFSLSLIWSYAYSIFTETKCPVPPISQFLEIPAYMAEFLFYAVLLNIVVDYFSWSMTQVALKRIAVWRGYKPVLLVLLTPIAMFVLLYIIYGLYLPLALISQQYGPSLALAVKIFPHHMLRGTVLEFFSPPKTLFVLDCANTDHTLFSISNLHTMQILAVETIIPMALLFTFCVLGIVIYVTKPFTQRPLSFLVQRIDSSGRTVTALLAGALFALAALMFAVHRALP
jgi:hypothetical protein